MKYPKTNRETSASKKIMEVKGDEFKDQIVAVFEADIMNLCVNS